MCARRIFDEYVSWRLVNKNALKERYSIETWNLNVHLLEVKMLDYIIDSIVEKTGDEVKDPKVINQNDTICKKIGLFCFTVWPVLWAHTYWDQVWVCPRQTWILFFTNVSLMISISSDKTYVLTVHRSFSLSNGNEKRAKNIL